MNTVICNKVKHPRVVIDVVTVEEIAKVSVKVFVTRVRADVVIDKLLEVEVDVTSDSASEIDVEVMTVIGANVLVSAMTDLSFAMSAP